MSDLVAQFWKPSSAEMDPEVAYKAQEGINDLLRERGRREETILGSWWDATTFKELHGLTPLQAWVLGNHEGVEMLLDRLEARVDESIRRLSKNSQRVEEVRLKLTRSK